MHSYIVDVYRNSKYICSVGIFANNYKHLASELKSIFQKGLLCVVTDCDDESLDLSYLGLIEVD